MAYDYSKLQNGSDIRGIAIGSPTEPINLDSEAVSRLAKGFLYLLSHNTDKEPNELCIAVGRDSRISGPELVRDIVSALTPYGVKVLDSGLSSTPAMFMSTVFEEFKGDIADIINFAESGSVLGRLIPKAASDPIKANLIDVYSAHLRKKIIDALDSGETPLSGLSITVDAGNGAGGFYAEKVLSPLGADVSSSQFLEPDGSFPNHIPNPEDKEAIESICARVREAKTDLGLIFDTDVDRVSAVDESGKEINRNAIVALAAALIADSHPGSTVVTDSVTSRGLTSFLEGSLGLKHLRFKRGYKNVINKSIELNAQGIESDLAIETSGHAAYKENFFLDDGAYLATKIVIAAAKCKKEGKGIASLISDLSEPLESLEVRLPIIGSDFGAVGDSIIEDLRTLTSSGELSECSLEEPNYEGVRINFNNSSIKGWMLLRKSLHEPIMPLNFESDVEGGCLKIAELLIPLLSKYENLDIGKLKDLV